MTQTLITDASATMHFKTKKRWEHDTHCLKRLSVQGLYTDDEDLGGVISTAKILSKSLNRGLVVYKAGIISDILPAKESVKELSEVIDSIVVGDRVYPFKNASNNCMDMLKFVDGGCSSCGAIEDCQSENIPKDVIESVTLKEDSGWGRSLYSGIDLEEFEESRALAYRFIPSAKTTRDFFSERWPCVDEINLSPEGIRGKSEELTSRNRAAASSRKFGNRECRNCALAENSYENFCSSGGSRWRRKYCSGRVTEQEFRDHIVEEVRKTWGVVPTWRNPGIHAALELIGCDATMDALGPKGHSGTVVRVFPSNDKKGFLVKTVRKWGAYREQVYTLKRFLKANPEHRHRLKRTKTKLSRDQSLMLAWMLSCAKVSRNKMFHGPWEEDFMSVDLSRHSTGPSKLEIRLTGWGTLHLGKLEHLHDPEYMDLWSHFRSYTYKETNW